jgi:RNA polymerase sigma factor (sigma-70 family)
MIHPDQKYIEGLINNDMVLLEEVYQKYSGKIEWMVLKNHGTPDDATDIFQEALLSIFHNARDPGFKLTCPLDAFLYVVCSNLWLNELNKRKRNARLIKDNRDILSEILGLGEDSIKLDEDGDLEQKRLNLVSEKFAELEESYQQLLSLSWGGKSMEEVAKTLHLTYGYVRKKKSRCIAKLIKLVKRSPQFSSLKESVY